MFFEKIIRFFKGYKVICITGKFPERFLNVCANKGIFLSDVTYLSASSVRVTISTKAAKELEAICEKTSVSAELQEEGGLPVLRRKYKKRKWLIAGPLMFAISLCVLNLFVWEIEITGCEKVLPRQIEENLAELGVKAGVPRFTIDQQRIKNEMLIRMPELSWIWVNKSGSRLIVNVRESVPRPEIFDKNDYCNIIAAKDGIIDSVIVREGTFMFNVGDTVLKNDILVSGLMLSERGIEPRYIQADAEIYARVWYEKTEKFPLYEKKITETGNTSKKRTIKLFGLEFTPFWYKSPEFSEYTTETKTSELSLFGKFLGVKVTTEKYKEHTSEIIPLAEESVCAAGTKAILAQTEQETASGSSLKSYDSSYVKNDDNTISVTVVAEYIENIAKKVKME